MGSVGVNKETTVKAISYPSLPIRVRLGSASKEEKAEARKIIKDFMNNAQVGDVYSVAGGIGSTGGSTFEIRNYRGTKNLALKWQNSNGNAVKMSAENVREYIKNGATLIERKLR